MHGRRQKKTIGGPGDAPRPLPVRRCGRARPASREVGRWTDDPELAVAPLAPGARGVGRGGRPAPAGAYRARAPVGC